MGVSNLFEAGKHDLIVPLVNALGKRTFKSDCLKVVAIRHAFGKDLAVAITAINSALIATARSFPKCMSDRHNFQTIALECSRSKCIHKWNNQIVFPSIEQVTDTHMNSTLLLSRIFYLVKNSEELLR